VSLPIVLAVNWSFGAWEKTSLLFILTWIYNDLNIIGFAFGLYNGGALRIACGKEYAITASGYWWVALISGVIFTTMHVQDMEDQIGDQARGRRSASLVLGDVLARWTIATPVAVWSVICPLFWALDILDLS